MTREECVECIIGARDFMTVTLDAEKIADAAMELEAKLIENKIPYQIRFHCGGVQFRFDERRDVILHEGSYGREEYKWESYGFPEDYDDVTGWLTPEDIVARFHKNKED